jgi:hypothetical protein
LIGRLLDATSRCREAFCSACGLPPLSATRDNISQRTAILRKRLCRKFPLHPNLKFSKSLAAGLSSFFYAPPFKSLQKTSKRFKNSFLPLVARITPVIFPGRQPPLKMSHHRLHRPILPPISKNARFSATPNANK